MQESSHTHKTFWLASRVARSEIESNFVMIIFTQMPSSNLLDQIKSNKVVFIYSIRKLCVRSEISKKKIKKKEKGRRGKNDFIEE